MRTRCRRRQSNRRHIPPSRSREKNESKATEIPANSVDFVHSTHTFQRFLNFHFKVLKSSKEARKWRKLVAGNKVSFSRAIFGCHYPWPRTTKIFVPLCTGVEILATPLYKYLYTQYTMHNTQCIIHMQSPLFPVFAQGRLTLALTVTLYSANGNTPHPVHPLRNRGCI